MLRTPSLALAALLAASIAPTASACDDAAPRTKLVKCGDQSCLVVSGHRADSTAKILINGHEVVAKGHHRWSAKLPVSAVRGWSAPRARSISVAVGDAAAEARLPVGLLAPSGNLAMLVVLVK